MAEFAAFEVAAALTLTRQAAASQLALAAAVVRRLPEVHAAMSSGDLDLPKARLISDILSTLDDAAARRVVAVVLPQAPSLTTGQLRARLEKLVIEADPDGAARRHAARVKSRRVVLQPGEDSCAGIFGLDLPAASAVAASHRLTAMANAAKRAGDPRSLDQLRADTFLDLLLGNTPAGHASPSGARGGVELTCDLKTLAHLADLPGHLHGYGSVIAEIARQVAEQQRHSPWTFTIYAASGRFHTGTIRRRPAPPNPTASPAPTQPARPPTPPPSPPGSAASSGTAGLRGARSSGAGESGGGPAPGGGVSGGRSCGGESAGRAVAAGERAGHDSSSGPMRGGWPGFGDPRRRFPNAALARHVRARDRLCRAPGCRRSASRADLDHTRAFEEGGLTEPGNLGALCRYHHRAKHEGRWTLRQVRPGIFVWRSPLGRYYTIRPEEP